jgi:hypothetical protein
LGVGGRPWSRPERPPERASSKAGDRTTRGCSGGARTILEVRIQTPGRPPGGTATRGGRAHSTHRNECRRPAGRTEKAPPGSSTLTQARLCRRDHHWYPPRRPIGQRPRVGVRGGAAATGHGAPRRATESPPGVAADRPRNSTSWSVRKGGTPPTGTGWNVNEELTTPPGRRRPLTNHCRPPLRGPFPLTYPPGSYQGIFREKMLRSKFVIPTGIILYGKRA